MLENFMEGIIPILAILGIFIVPPIVIAVVLLKYFAGKNKERLAMIAQGIMPQEVIKKKGAPERLRTLRTALGSIGAGVGVVIGIILNNYLFGELGELEKFAVVVASASLFFGIGYAVYFVLSKDKIEEQDSEEI